MGYQESLVFIRPQRMFDAMVRKCEQAFKNGYYAALGAEPASVITLKQSLGGIPPGTKLLWVCGDRGFHHEMGVFNGKLSTQNYYRLKIIPAERLFECEDDVKLRGIDLGIYHLPSENAHLRRESFQQYAQRLHSREEMER